MNILNTNFSKSQLSKIVDVHLDNSKKYKDKVKLEFRIFEKLHSRIEFTIEKYTIN